MKNNILIIIIFACLSTQCIDKFADLNTNPAVIGTADIRYLATQALQNFEPSGYTYWFYNSNYTLQWTQSFVPTGGLPPTFREHGSLGNQGSQIYEVLKYYREIKDVISTLTTDEAQKYQGIQGILSTLIVYLGIFDTDMFGDIPYTEACMAKYTSPSLLTPKYDKMEDLYSLWLTELNNAIASFNAEDQVSMGNQDFVYKGDFKKWAKLANSLKLKLAVRYLHVNKTKAFEITKDVANNSAGVFDRLADDFIYNKATTSISDNDRNAVYHFGDAVYLGAGSKPVIDLLVKNLDPRVRFFYNKNDFNSIVVTKMLADATIKKTAVPSQILQYINFGADSVFDGWKSPGEPWVRYCGLPNKVNDGDANSPFYTDYFRTNYWKIGNKTYRPYSAFQEELIRGRVSYTYPDLPGTVAEDKENMPWWGMSMSTAEVNLYLAELKLLGADLPQTAEYYYKKGVEMSVMAYDNLAKLNKIPYYGKKHDPIEITIDLKESEITTMMTNTDYQLTGNRADDLEKIYIQQYLHFTYQPTDQFVTVRRSGIPKVGSTILPWINNGVIPRRFDVTAPNLTDIMISQKEEAYQRQGFTPSSNNNPTILNSERLWQDKGTPNFGEGPNL